MADETDLVGECAWAGTIGEFLALNRGVFIDAMREGTYKRMFNDKTISIGQYRAWRDEFRHLRRELSRLCSRWKQSIGLCIAFEYVIPGHPDKDTGRVEYIKIPDVVIFSSNQVLVLEFKQREPPPYDGFAKETRGYLRLLEKWHPDIPRMNAKGALVLTKSIEFQMRYPRVLAISPDRIPAVVRKVFAGTDISSEPPRDFLRRIRKA